MVIVSALREATTVIATAPRPGLAHAAQRA